MTAISVRDVFVVHSTQDGEAAALQGLSLDVAAGELLVVLGPSGSGKTSLLRALAGLLRPSSGRLRVLGQDVEKLRGRELASYRARTLGYLDQHYWRVLLPELTVREMVGLQLAFRGWVRDAYRERAEELLAIVGLGSKSRDRVNTLSGGEQQRVALCAALAHRPRVLLADEPTGELDVKNAAKVARLTRDMTEAIGCTTIVVTHDHRWQEVADRVVRIRDGRVTEELKASARGRETLVVDDRGWVRIPEDVRIRSGVSDRVHIESSGDGIVLRPLARAQAIEPVMATAPRASHCVANMAASGPREPSAVAVSVRALRKAYGREVVLDSIDAEFSSGSYHVVTGPSGCGKTTLLRLIAALETFDEGEIFIGELSLRSMNEEARTSLRRSEIAYVSQQSMLIDHLTTIENVELGLSIRGLAGIGAVAPALEEVGLATRGGHRLRRLSAGERARVALARALAASSAVVVLDEPTSRLDEANVRLIAALLARIARTRGVTVICATHDPAVIALADANLELADSAPTR